MPAGLRMPSYRLHNPSGQAVVSLGGRDVYPGKHGTTKSRDAHDRTIAECAEVCRVVGRGVAHRTTFHSDPHTSLLP